MDSLGGSEDTNCLSVVSSPPRLDQYMFLLKHQLEGSVTETKEGVMFQEKITGAGGTHYLLWYWQHSSCVLCLASVVYRLGYLSPIKTESGLLSNTLPC